MHAINAAIHRKIAVHLKYDSLFYSRLPAAEFTSEIRKYIGWAADKSLTSLVSVTFITAQRQIYVEQSSDALCRQTADADKKSELARLLRRGKRDAWMRSYDDDDDDDDLRIQSMRKLVRNTFTVSVSCKII